MAPSLGGDDMVVSDGEVVECIKHFLTYRNAVSAEEAGKGGFLFFFVFFLTYRNAVGAEAKEVRGRY